MNYQKYVKAIEEACYDSWVQIFPRVYLFKTRDGGVAVVSSNVESFGVVIEWQSDCYRLVNGAKITGANWTGSDMDEICNNLICELKFLSSIIVPERK